jgi:hypothetical protein
MAVLKPRPGTPPMMLFTGTRTLSKMTSQVFVPRWPILRSGSPSVIPGVDAGTIKAEIPLAPACSLSVRAITVKPAARVAFVMKRFVPLMT